MPELSGALSAKIDELGLYEEESKGVKDNVGKVVGADVVYLHTTDIDGRSLAVDIPGSRFESVVLSGQGIDGSSIKGSGRGVNESDMWMRPDLTTARVIPFEGNGRRTMARVVANLYDVNGSPVDTDPRNILTRQLERAREMGYRFIVSPELEFFIFPKDPDGRPVVISEGNGRYYLHEPGAMADLRAEMMDRLRQMGLDVEAGHNEVAHNQYEINTAAQDALKQADNVVLFRNIVRSTAEEYGRYATFMPKPVFGVNGSGAHMNLSLVDIGSGENAFYEEGAPNNLSGVARYAVKGLLDHVKAFMPVTNPGINSFKRLVPGFEAPTYLAWGPMNRSALIRVPNAKNPRSTRLELRSPDPSFNPYLAEAVILAACLDGIEKRQEPPSPTTEDIFEKAPDELMEMGIESLPGSMYEALQFFRRDEVIREALGPNMHQMYYEAKMADWLEYIQQVTPWELARYLGM